MTTSGNGCLLHIAATKLSASAPAFRPVVRADGPWLVSGGAVLLLDVLPQDGDGCRRRTRRSRAPTIPPVMAGQVRGFLPHPAGGDARKAASQPGDRRRGREVHHGWAWFASPLNSASSVPKSPRASRRICSVQSKIEGCGEHRMPVLSHAGQVGHATMTTRYRPVRMSWFQL